MPVPTTSNRPYYQTIRKTEEFLAHYLHIYEGDYSKRRLSAIKQLFPETKNLKVLEIGCGGGKYSSVVASKGCKDIVTLDLEKVCVKATQQNVSLTCGITTKGVMGDSTNLPFQNCTFDLVICIDLVEHVSNDEKLVEEIHRVLNPNGSLVIATQNCVSLNFLIEGFFQRVISRKHWMGWDSTHVRFYNSKSLFCLLKDFRVVTISGTYFLPYNLSPTIMQRFAITINDLFESKCTTAPWSYSGWGIACICTRSSR